MRREMQPCGSAVRALDSEAVSTGKQKMCDSMFSSKKCIYTPHACPEQHFKVGLGSFADSWNDNPLVSPCQGQMDP